MEKEWVRTRSWYIRSIYCMQTLREAPSYKPPLLLVMALHPLWRSHHTERSSHQQGVVQHIHSKWVSQGISNALSLCKVLPALWLSIPEIHVGTGPGPCLQELAEGWNTHTCAPFISTENHFWIQSCVWNGSCRMNGISRMKTGRRKLQRLMDSFSKHTHKGLLWEKGKFCPQRAEWVLGASRTSFDVRLAKEFLIT